MSGWSGPCTTSLARNALRWKPSACSASPVVVTHDHDAIPYVRITTKNKNKKDVKATQDSTQTFRDGCHCYVVMIVRDVDIVDDDHHKMMLRILEVLLLLLYTTKKTTLLDNSLRGKKKAKAKAKAKKKTGNPPPHHMAATKKHENSFNSRARPIQPHPTRPDPTHLARSAARQGC